MKSRFFFALAAWFLTSVPSLADQYLDEAQACRDALAYKDQEAFENSAGTILRWRSVFNTQALLVARDCLSEGFNEPWEYHTPSARFVKSSDLGPERANAAEKARLAAEAAQRQAEAQLLAEAAEERERAAQQAFYAQRRALVQMAVVEACNDLFEDDRVQALTNAVCIDIFLVQGLPTD